MFKPRIARSTFVLLTMTVATLWLAGCGDAPQQTTQQNLYGRWLNDEQHSVMQLNPDGTFKISRRSETPDDMTGTFTLKPEGRVLTFVTSGDATNCPGMIGTYTYRFENRKLIFTKEIDDCTWRDNEMIFPWVNIQPTVTQP